MEGGICSIASQLEGRLNMGTSLRSLRRWVNSVYDQMLSASYITGQIAVPPRVLRYYVNLPSSEYVTTIHRFVETKDRVLVIGDAGGRDSYFLCISGKQVVVLDIAPQALPSMVLGDVSAGLPFFDASFDAVVMAEVIEHLIDDIAALWEIRRVLKDDGILALTVPFFHDDADYHVRVHSPLSIKRLLAACGFRVLEYVERGGGFAELLHSRWLFRMALHLSSFLVFSVSRRTVYEPVNRVLAAVDEYFGRHEYSLWHRWSQHYGAMLKCCKGPVINYQAINRAVFANLTQGIEKRGDEPEK